MIGAIAGDIVGSIYEWENIKTTEFPLFGKGCCFTDDTVMSVAVADWLMQGGNLENTLKAYGRRYPYAGYGEFFIDWLQSETSKPYNSWGNGSAMRVSPVGWLFDTFEETLNVARQTAEITHNHPKGIKGAQATALCIYLARIGESKEYIKDSTQKLFGYNLDRTCDEIRPDYLFDVSCQGTVPEAIIAFLESNNFESAIRLAVSLGGDCDTLTCITGGIAEAYYGIPPWIKKEALNRLTDDLRNIVIEFEKRLIS